MNDRFAPLASANPREPAAPASLGVTTAHRATAEMLGRAREVSLRCGAPLLERRSLPKLLEDFALVYVVGRREECVQSAEGRLIAGEGLMKLKRLDGRQHPLVRAVAPVDGEAPRVFDATLGLAQDALHLSVVAGLDVDGVDAQPALICLVENFLKRAAERWGSAPQRLTVRFGDSTEVLRALPADAYDVVYFDPMFDVAMPAQPDFQVLRRLADERPLEASTLAEAVRVAKQRVVVKVRTLAEPTADPPAPGWNRRVSGRAFNYWIVEKALAHPELEPLRVKYSMQKLRFLGLL